MLLVERERFRLLPFIGHRRNGRTKCTLIENKSKIIMVCGNDNGSSISIRLFKHICPKRQNKKKPVKANVNKPS